MCRYGHTDTEAVRKRIAIFNLILGLESHVDALAEKTPWGNGSAKLCIVGKPFSVCYFLRAFSALSQPSEKTGSLHNELPNLHMQHLLRSCIYIGIKNRRPPSSLPGPLHPPPLLCLSTPSLISTSTPTLSHSQTCHPSLISLHK